MEDIAQYRDQLLAEVRAGAEAGGNYERVNFLDRACQILEASEEFTEYSLCRAHAQWRGATLQVDAYSYSESDGTLSLIIGDYAGSAELESLRTDDVRRFFKSAHAFLEGSISSDAARAWDESHEAHQLSQAVFEYSSEGLTKTRIYLVSDRISGRALGTVPEYSVGLMPVEAQIWDMGRLARADMSDRGREQLQIDFPEEFGRGIPSLAAGLDLASNYQSYMCVMPGDVLATLYDRFGGRILEQNVRAFLGDTRKVNKGIRETIKTSPEMFFAYNNGLTVTVSTADFVLGESGELSLHRASDFQIVNGGQTTASLYWARKAGLDLSKIFVQMKLSVLPAEDFEDAVRAISRYANAQNAVSASDLFAGHPYFKRLETLSRQILAPSAMAGDVSGYWFFERTQGSYNVEVKRHKGTAARAWEVLRPRKQRLGKTDVARYEVTWGAQPHTVCTGSQKNMAVFGKVIASAWSDNPEAFDTTYFKRLVARAILTRAVDAAIPSQSWYPGSVLRQLSSYAISLIAERMASEGLDLAYDLIWKAQAAPASFVKEAMLIARQVMPLLTEIPSEIVRNRLVTEWAKREACWLRVVESDLELSPEFKATLVTASVSASRVKTTWRARAHELWRSGEWKRLRDWNRKNEVLTADEGELVERAAVAADFGFRGFRLVKLEEAWKRAVSEGFV